MIDPKGLRILDVSYTLPAGRIAQHPLKDRDSSRLLVFRDGHIADHVFRDLPDLLPQRALLVMNDTRVVNARLLFHKASGAGIEVFCLEPAEGGPLEEALRQRGEVTWRCTIGNARRWKEGPLTRSFSTDRGDLQLVAVRLPDDDEGARVRLTWTPADLTFGEVLHRAGAVPLPPYMKRDADALDTERYQTVFARAEGSVAAPTGGLHFTPSLLNALERRGVERVHVTLHVGAGTFQPVHAETMAGHVMHQERVRIPRGTIERLSDVIGDRPVVATGTTSLRTMESIYWHGVRIAGRADVEEMNVGQWEPYDVPLDHQLPTKEALAAVLAWMDEKHLDQLTGSTSLLIAPGYRIRTADALITNFHQPGSTLLLLVAAFVGPDWRRIYEHALGHDYRFLSYGDGSLLFRGQ